MLTKEQKGIILTRSREARQFVGSSLFQNFENWVKQEQEMTASAIVMNSRNDNQKNMSRQEFVDNLSGYYLALATCIGVFKGWGKQEEELHKMEEHERTKTKS